MQPSGTLLKFISAWFWESRAVRFNGNIVIHPRQLAVIWHDEYGLRVIASSHEAKRDHPEHWAIMERLTSFTFDEGTEREIATIKDGSLHLNSIGLFQIAAHHSHKERADMTFEPSCDLKHYFEPNQVSYNNALEWLHGVFPHLIDGNGAGELPIGSFERYVAGVERELRGWFWDFHGAQIVR